jgi:hypothetical protein
MAIAFMPLDEAILEQGPGILRVSFPEVGGGYELKSSRPMAQAMGDCCGVKFYFRAKHGEWEFETEDVRGQPFPAADARAFAMRGAYDDNKPTVMEVEWARRLLRQCLAEFWNRPKPDHTQLALPLRRPLDTPSHAGPAR